MLGPAEASLVAVALGLRHAADPDHLAAVAAHIASQGARSARALGLAWGAGHATTLIACGLPVVLATAALPDGAQRAAEAAVGVLIVLLALRLLVRWRRGRLHALGGRSLLQAYGIGLLHGAGGSAAIGVLLLAGIADRAVAAIALVLLALATAAAMWALSWGFGRALARAPLLAVPVMAVASLGFGTWYTLGALQA